VRRFYLQTLPRLLFRGDLRINTWKTAKLAMSFQLLFELGIFEEKRGTYIAYNYVFESKIVWLIVLHLKFVCNLIFKI